MKFAECEAALKEGKKIKLSTADVAYFAEGWDEARGCKIEHECAVEYGINRIEM